MKVFKSIGLSLIGTALLSMQAIQPAVAQTGETLLLRSPTVSNSNLAFVYGGDIWIANRDGSNPRRLTVNPAVETSPIFSPDGKQIAFTGNYDGNTDIYTISIYGGEPKRVTYHPSADLVKGWLNNNEVYFTSTRDYKYALTSRMHSIGIDGKNEKPLPMPEAVQGSPSSDKRYWAYIKTPIPTDRSNVAFKRYRGGGMPRILGSSIPKQTILKLFQELGPITLNHNGWVTKCIS